VAFPGQVSLVSVARVRRESGQVAGVWSPRVSGVDLGDEPAKAQHPLQGRTRDLIEFARRHGFAREEIIHMIESMP
jgi:hypothetical protein